MTAIHIPPSWFVRQTRRYRSWCSITICKECGLRAKYEDCHPTDPCLHCGGKMLPNTGRWKVTHPGIFFGILRREQGEWELRYKPNEQKT